MSPLCRFYFILRFLFSAYLLFLYGLRNKRQKKKTNTRSNGMRMIVSTNKRFFNAHNNNINSSFFVYIFCICPPVENNLENRLLIHWFLPINVCFLCLSADSFFFLLEEKMQNLLKFDWLMGFFFLISEFFDDLILVSVRMENISMNTLLRRCQQRERNNFEIFDSSCLETRFVSATFIYTASIYLISNLL